MVNILILTNLTLYSHTNTMSIFVPFFFFFFNPKKEYGLQIINVRSQLKVRTTNFW